MSKICHAFPLWHKNRTVRLSDFALQAFVYLEMQLCLIVALYHCFAYDIFNCDKGTGLSKKEDLI